MIDHLILNPLFIEEKVITKSAQGFSDSLLTEDLHVQLQEMKYLYKKNQNQTSYIMCYIKYMIIFKDIIINKYFFLLRLHKTQDLLYESTKDFLELRYQGRSNERLWMGEKDKLLRDLDNVKLQLHPNRDPVLNMSDGAFDRAGCVEEMKVILRGWG